MNRGETLGDNQGVEDSVKGCPPHIEADEVGNDMTTPISKRTTSPAYQFYPGDFVKDENVLLMSFTEIGVYQILLCHAWTNRGLPNSTAAIAAMLKLPHARFKKLWAGALGQCFVERNGRFVNPRQEKERQKQADYRRRQSDNGSKGGRPVRSQQQPTDNPPLSSGKAHALKTEEEDSGSLVVPKKKEEPNDVAFRKFQQRYPGSGRKGSRMLEEAFCVAAEKAGGASVLLAALENHIASERWSNPKYIPGMDTWFAEQRWLQELPPAGPITASANNPKTAGNFAALQRFIDRGKAS